MVPLGPFYTKNTNYYTNYTRLPEIYHAAIVTTSWAKAEYPNIIVSNTMDKHQPSLTDEGPHYYSSGQN